MTTQSADMSPHRVGAEVWTYSAHSLRSLAQIPVDSAGVVVAGATAAIGMALGQANSSMLLIVGLAMVADLLVGAMRAVVDPLDSFSVQKLYGGFLGKIFRLMLIPVLSLVDWLYIASPLPLPEGYEHAFPITAFGLFALAAAEITSALNHFRNGGVAPSAIAAVIRHLDRMRSGMEPPVRRHYDPPAIAELKHLGKTDEQVKNGEDDEDEDDGTGKV